MREKLQHDVLFNSWTDVGSVVGVLLFRAVEYGDEVWGTLPLILRGHDSITAPASP